MPQVPSADLTVNKAIEGAAPDSTLVITITQGKPLKIGNYLFRLVVADSSGNASAAVTHRLLVQDSGAPNAVITGPRNVPFGKEFTLSGAESADPEGQPISRYVWTLIEAP